MKNLSGVLFTGSVAGVVLFSVAPGLGASVMFSLGNLGRSFLLLYGKNRLAPFLPTTDTFIATINGLHDMGTLVLFAFASLHRSSTRIPAITRTRAR